MGRRAGMNGTLLMTSQNPFNYQGESFFFSERRYHGLWVNGRAGTLIITGITLGNKVIWKFDLSKVNAELYRQKGRICSDFRNTEEPGTTGGVLRRETGRRSHYDGYHDWWMKTTLISVIFMRASAGSLRVCSTANLFSATIYCLHSKRFA